MSRDLKLLEPEFREMVEARLIPHCKGLGYILVPFFTLRTPWRQARLWRQSRPFTQIQRATTMLRGAGAPFLAEVLLSVGPQHGRWATNGLPGQSWHQWGEGIDCFISESGRAIWDHNHPGYQAYAREAVLLGLDAGYYWQHRDSCHVQKQAGRVLSFHSWREIEAEMIERFGKEEPK